MEARLKSGIWVKALIRRCDLAAIGVAVMARGDNDVLVLRPLDQDGHVLAEQRLGVQVSGAFAARWDLVHQQLGRGHGFERAISARRSAIEGA